MSAKERLYQILERPQRTDVTARRWQLVITTIIAINVLAVILGTVESIRTRFGALLFWIEAWSVAIFAVEYLLRLWVITCSPRFAAPLIGRVRYMLTPLALIDLAAIAPFFIAPRLDLRFVRLARTFRVFRVLKFARYSQALALIARVLRRRREQLIVALGVILLLIVTASSLMYFAEHEAQPTAFSSIPATMWWAVMTITTVGYGDVYPITHIGRALAGVIALLGIGSFALPTSILGAGFLEEVARPSTVATCPHCGSAL